MRDPTNLVIGAALVAGCGSRTVPGNDETSTSEGMAADGSTESTSGADTTSTDTTSTDTTETDTGYYDDPYCLLDLFCPDFTLCIDHVCQEVGTPPPSCGLPEFDIPVPLELEGSSPALTFADLDDDGRDELVALTHDDSLVVFESGWNIPTEPTGCEFVDFNYNNYLTFMAAGQFDDQPGEDIAVVAGGIISMCFSDGAGGFASQSEGPSPLDVGSRVIAGEFDGQPPMDLILFGSAGAGLLGADVVLFSESDFTAGAAFGFGTPHAGAAFLEQDLDLVLLDLAGTIQANQPSRSNLVGITSPDAARYIATTRHLTTVDPAGQNWYEVALLDPVTLDEDSRLLVSDAAVLIPGDFDGDQAQDLLVAEDGWNVAGDTSVIFGLFTEPCIATQDVGTEFRVDEHAVGDHDGDGDDEVAIQFHPPFQDDFLVLVDVE